MPMAMPSYETRVVQARTHRVHELDVEIGVADSGIPTAVGRYFAWYAVIDPDGVPSPQAGIVAAQSVDQAFHKAARAFCSRVEAYGPQPARA